MAIATLQAILDKIRRLIGGPSPLQISEESLKDYVNSFYLYDLPAQFRNLKLKDKYTFDTTRGVDVYPFDSERFTTIEQPVTVAKRTIPLYYDPWPFFQIGNINSNNVWQELQNFATGDGTTGPYTGTAQSTPFLRSANNNPVFAANPNYPASRVQNILITANVALGSTQNVTDDGFGNLIQQVGNTTVNAGTINYETGAIDVSFNLPIPAGNAIQLQYVPVVLNTPLALLFFQNQFTLRPVPDRGYTVELIAYRQPSQALSETAGNLGTPELNEWWELIAVGAAKKFYEDTMDDQGIAMCQRMLMEKYSLANTRTYAEMGKQRISTIYADQLDFNNGGGSSLWGPF